MGGVERDVQPSPPVGSKSLWPRSRREARLLSISIRPSPEPIVLVTIWSKAQSAGSG
ncbi:hypothetical protein STANM309S_04498 [Streptomyces tanashiensis]